MARNNNSLVLRTNHNILLINHIICCAKLVDSDPVPNIIFLDFKNLVSFHKIMDFHR